MSDADQIPAGDTGTLTAATSFLDGIFGAAPADPGTPAPLDTSQPAPADGQAPAPEAAKPAEPEKGSLAELIRAERTAKAARQVKERESADLRTQLAERDAQLAKLSKADIVGDPIGFAQAHGLSEAEMALVGQAYLYHLVPDKAPQDLRFKLLEAKQARELKARDAQREQEAQQAAAERATQQVQGYTAVLGAAVETWEGSGAHPFPESRAWFGGNHEEYAESLVHTARNAAEDARARGEVADLSPKAIADLLERDLASRTARIRGAGSKPTQQSAIAAPAAGGKQPAVLSTKGQGGSPMPKATTEEERLKRAMEVVFGSR